MIFYENECVDCPKEIGCVGKSCPNRHVPHTRCDDCQDEDVDLFEYDNEELCIDCIEKRLAKVAIRSFEE